MKPASRPTNSRHTRASCVDQEPDHMPLSEPNQLLQAAPNEPRDDEEKANLRQSLYDHLMSLDPGVVRQMLFNHTRQCTLPSCPTCTRVPERAAQRKQERKKLDKRMSRFRGVAKSIGPLLAARRRAAEVAYAPGGRGYQAARESFVGRQCEECSH